MHSLGPNIARIHPPLIRAIFGPNSCNIYGIPFNAIQYNISIPWKLRPFNIVVIITNTRLFVYFQHKPKRVQYRSILHASTIQLKCHVYVIIYYNLRSGRLIHRMTRLTLKFGPRSICWNIWDLFCVAWRWGSHFVG